MRLFIPVPLPTELTDRAAALLPAALPALKRVGPELMHVTLAFLGWTPDDQLDAVVAAGRVAAQAQGPFELVFACAGRFPDRGKPRVVWLGIGAGKPELATLAGAVPDELRRRDLKFDDRPFAPHLTLARARTEAPGPAAPTAAAARAAPA